MNEHEKNDSEFQEAVEKAVEEIAAKGNKRNKLILLILLLIPLLYLIYGVFFATFHCNCGAWNGPKTAVSTIKAAVETYKAKHDGDLSRLQKLPSTFIKGSELLKELRLVDDAFENLQYSDSEDYYLIIIDGENSDNFVIVYNAEIGTGQGLSKKGLSEGISKYDSRTNEWSGIFE